jgi:hypothetical protein
MNYILTFIIFVWLNIYINIFFQWKATLVTYAKQTMTVLLLLQNAEQIV